MWSSNGTQMQSCAKFLFFPILSVHLCDCMSVTCQKSKLRACGPLSPSSLARLATWSSEVGSGWSHGPFRLLPLPFTEQSAPEPESCLAPVASVPSRMTDWVSHLQVAAAKPWVRPGTGSSPAEPTPSRPSAPLGFCSQPFLSPPLAVQRDECQDAGLRDVSAHPAAHLA